MIDADEAGIGDQVEALLAAIVRMRPPADIGEQAGGVAEPPLRRRLVQAEAVEEAVAPGTQLLAMLRRARAQEVELVGGGEQRVDRLRLGREPLVEEALAHAERGHDDLLRIARPDDLVEHDGAVGEERPARLRDRFDALQRTGILAFDEPQEVEPFLRVEHVAVHDAQGVVAGGQVQACEGAPGAADRIKGTALKAPERPRPLEGLAGDALRLLDRAAAEGLQGEDADLKGDAGADLAPGDLGQFQAATAEVADDAVGLVEARDDAERGELRLAGTRQQLDRVAAGIRRRLQEGLAVRGVSGRSGRDHADVADMHGFAEHAVAGERLEGALHGFLVEPAGGGHVAPEAAHDLLVVERHRRARQAFVGDEADGVRADIDNGDGAADLEPARSRVEQHVEPIAARRAWRASGGWTS